MNPLHTLQLHIEDHVATVTLSRPEVRNAFNPQMIAELQSVFEHLSCQAEHGVRAVVLRSQGKAFCAGADLGWMQSMAQHTWDENFTDAQALAKMLWTLHQCPLPVVGRIQGDCFAGGVGLAAVCDIVLAVESVQFCLSEVKLGLIPATISPYVIKALGERAAQRYFITAEKFNALEAKHFGLVHEVCADTSALDAQLQTLLSTLLTNGPQAVQASKRLVQDIAHQPQSPELRLETARRIANTRISPEGQEGIRSFLDKRSPAWITS